MYDNGCSNFVHVEEICSLAVRMALFIAAANSRASPEPEIRTYDLKDIDPPSSFSISPGHQSSKVSTAHVHPRRASSTRIRSSLGAQTAASGDCITSHTWRSVIKKVLVYHDSGSALVVRKDGTAEFTNIQDAIDQVPEFKKTISVTSGIYAEKVIIPAIKPCLALQAEGRNRTITSWHEIAASEGTLMSSSDVIVESDHFIARDIPLRDKGEVQPQTNHISKQPQSASPLRCNFYSHQDTLYDPQGRRYYFRCFFQGSDIFAFGGAQPHFQLRSRA